MKIGAARSIALVLITSLVAMQAARSQSRGNANLAASPQAQVSQLTEQLKTSYNNADLHYLLGNAYVSLKQLNSAKMQYHICIELNPNSQSAAYSRQALQSMTAPTPGSVAPSRSMLQTVVPAAPAPPTAMAPPTVTTIDQISAPVGALITISGTGFSPVLAANVVMIGSAKADLVSVSPTSLRCTVPGSSLWPAWNVPITVTSGGQRCTGNVTMNVMAGFVSP